MSPKEEERNPFKRKQNMDLYIDVNIVISKQRIHQLKRNTLMKNIGTIMFSLLCADLLMLPVDNDNFIVLSVFQQRSAA